MGTMLKDIFHTKYYFQALVITFAILFNQFSLLQTVYT